MKYKKFIFLLLIWLLFTSYIYLIDFSDNSNNSDNSFQNPLCYDNPICPKPITAESGGYGAEWYRTYGTLTGDYCWDMALSSSSNIYLVGNDGSDIRIVKYDSSGNFQWTREWNNGGDENGNAIAIDLFGDVYAAGSSDNEICLIKYSSSGSLQWSRTLSVSDIDQAFAVAVDSSNNVYIAGESYTSTPPWSLRDFVLAKYSSSGSLQWTRTLDLAEEDVCKAIFIDSNNIYLAGTSRYDYGGSIRFTVAKYSSGGSLQWSRTWNTGSANVDCGGICLDSSNNIYLAGEALYGSSSYQMLLVKFNSAGTYQWNRKWGGSGYDKATDVVYHSSGFIYLSGGTTSFGAGGYDFCLVKYSTDGVFQDFDTWGGSDYDKGNAIDIRSGKIYMGGSTQSYGAGNYDFCVVKLNPSPQITINSPTIDQPVGKQAPYYDVDIVDSDLIEKYYKVNGGTKQTFSSSTGYINQLDWENCEDGPVVITFYARDPGGTVYEEVTVQKDTVGPNITILTPFPNESFGNYSMEYEVSIENDDYDSIWYSLNGGRNITVKSLSGIINQDAWGQLDNGSITIRFFANDSLNNIEYNEVIVQKDLYYPFIYIFSPSVGEVFGLQSPEYNISVPCINLDTIWYSINNSVNYTITEMVGILNHTEWDSYGNGSLILKFFANTSEGIINSEQFNIFKDTTVPNITIINPLPLQVYGNRTFSFELSITNSDYTDIWYTINSSDKYYASGLSDTVNLTLWESFTSGLLLINFYVQNSLGYTGVKNITIVKDLKYLYPKNAYAIVIGIDNYPGSDNDLLYCVQDAIGIKDLLLNDYNFYSANIIRLYNSEASSSGIYDAFSSIRDKIYPNDLFFFYFSGHGGSNGGNSQYICPYDSIPSNPSANFYDTDLDAQLDLLNTTQKYIIIDSCYSGGMKDEGATSGRLFISACRKDEYSYETHYLHHGIFTYFFLKSYSDAPDINGDGITSMEEQFYYTRDETFQWAGMNLLVSQRPTMYDGISGHAILPPQIGPIIASIIDNQINFTFTIYGQGKIDILNFTLCSVNSEIVIQSQDILSQTISIDGFGVYSGAIELSSGDPITGYEAYAEVSGYKSKVIRRTYGDSDGDGLCDLFEYYLGGGIDPRLNDTDNDGLNDYDEYYGITDPLMNDTDSDGILDGIEVNFYGSNPISNDSDSDNLLDGYEAYISGTSLIDSDSDDDELSDYFELFNSSTNPLDSDTDNDLLLDADEIYVYGTNPNLFDTDGDGYGDGWEIENDYDPLDPDDHPDEDKDENTEESHESDNIVIIFFVIGIIATIFIVTIVFLKNKKPKTQATEKIVSPQLKESIVLDKNKYVNNSYKFQRPKFCTKCGFKLGLTQNFCTNCGNKIVKN